MIAVVIGKGRNCPEELCDLAHEVGAAVGRSGHVLVTGGLGGVMLHAAIGAADEGGRVIGLVPAGREPDERFPGLVLRTGLTEPVRNVVTGSCADFMLVLWGSHGTAQELAVATDRGIPVAAVETGHWVTMAKGPILQRGQVEGWIKSLND